MRGFPAWPVALHAGHLTARFVQSIRQLEQKYFTDVVVNPSSPPENLGGITRKNVGVIRASTLKGHFGYQSRHRKADKQMEDLEMSFFNNTV